MVIKVVYFNKILLVRLAQRLGLGTRKLLEPDYLGRAEVLRVSDGALEAEALVFGHLELVRLEPDVELGLALDRRVGQVARRARFGLARRRQATPAKLLHGSFVNDDHLDNHRESSKAVCGLAAVVARVAGLGRADAQLAGLGHVYPARQEVCGLVVAGPANYHVLVMHHDRTAQVEVGAFLDGNHICRRAGARESSSLARLASCQDDRRWASRD